MIVHKFLRLILFIFSSSWAIPIPFKKLRQIPSGYTSTFSKERIPILIDPPSNPPALPHQGAAITGKYRNLFVEYGFKEADVEARLQDIVEQLFYGDPDEERVFFRASDGSGGYIEDIADNDVRTEGMSYGMMVAVQLNNQTLFDSIWDWAKQHMEHSQPSDPRYGYFSWHASTGGNSMDPNPASDGETWFITGLYMAYSRWNDQKYRDAADLILHASMSKTGSGKGGSIYPMWNNHTGVENAESQVVFVPYGNSATFTDPSYQLPGFYELWRAHALSRDSAIANLAESLRDSSRNFLMELCPGSGSGLCSDYTDFKGSPHGSGNTFHFDAWRVAQNVGMDFAWFSKDNREVDFCNRLLRFFAAQNKSTSKPYGNHFNVQSGKQLGGDHSPGLVAMNAVCTLASDQSVAWEFVADLWATPIPTGKYRYYDGVLYLLGWLQVSGKFQYWA